MSAETACCRRRRPRERRARAKRELNANMDEDRAATFIEFKWAQQPPSWCTVPKGRRSSTLQLQPPCGDDYVVVSSLKRRRTPVGCETSFQSTTFRDRFIQITLTSLCCCLPSDSVSPTVLRRSLCLGRLTSAWGFRSSTERARIYACPVFIGHRTCKSACQAVTATLSCFYKNHLSFRNSF